MPRRARPEGTGDRKNSSWENDFFWINDYFQMIFGKSIVIARRAATKQSMKLLIDKRQPSWMASIQCFARRDCMLVRTNKKRSPEKHQSEERFFIMTRG
jgi:hypothetical protein